MQRQLQGPGAPYPGANSVAPVAKGGTGATTPEQAATNLGALHKTRYNVPGGILQAGEGGLFPSWALLGGGISVGYAIEGPLSLVKGQASTYAITNYNALSPAVASVDAGTVTVNGDQLTITAPTDKDKVVLTLGGRRITIPVYAFGPVKPTILLDNKSTVNRGFTIMLKPYKSEPEVKTDWKVVTTSGAAVAIPAGTTAIEIMGRAGTSGTAYAALGTSNYTLPVSTICRRIEVAGQSTVNFYFSGTGNINYRFITPSSQHLATDWQIASDPNFTTVVKQSLNDTVNKTSWYVYLPPGPYYIRAKFRGQL